MKIHTSCMRTPMTWYYRTKIDDSIQICMNTSRLQLQQKSRYFNCFSIIFAESLLLYFDRSIFAILLLSGGVFLVYFVTSLSETLF